MAKYDKVGGGTWGAYRKRPPVWPWIVLLGIVLIGLSGS